MWGPSDIGVCEGGGKNRETEGRGKRRREVNRNREEFEDRKQETRFFFFAKEWWETGRGLATVFRIS